MKTTLKTLGIGLLFQIACIAAVLAAVSLLGALFNR